MIDLLGTAHPLSKRDNMIIAPIGYARAGKDEFANILVNEYGFTRFAFADKLRECLYALNPMVGTQGETVQIVIDAWGWGGYKESGFSDEIRRLLQRMGTEMGRDTIDQNIWVNELDKVEANKIVVTDCRFPNEYNKIVKLGAKVVRVERAGNKPVNGHSSETALEHVVTKTIFQNNSTLEAYHDSIRNYMENLV